MIHPVAAVLLVKRYGRSIYSDQKFLLISYELRVFQIKRRKMKKSIYILFAFILAVGFASLGFSPVAATAITTPGHPQKADPTAVPNVTGASMTAEVLDVSVLPGTLQLNSGVYGPVGFKAGDVQFGGSGLKVSGLTGGNKATVCFAFPSYRYKWDGKIEEWNGTKWVSLVTTFTKDGDGIVNWACTSAAGNGTYSLIIWYYGPAEPPVVTEVIFS